MRQKDALMQLGRWAAVGLVLMLTFATSANTAFVQAESSTIIRLESPTSDNPVGTRIMISGWAADPSGTGSGVDLVQIYLGDPNAGGQALGEATYGQPRADVARLLGDPRFTNSGYQLAVELPPGEYTVYVYAHLNGAGAEEGWAVYSAPFSASATARSDPQAVALLGGDQPQVRTAAPPVNPSGTNNSGSASSRGGQQSSGTRSSSGFTASVESSSGAIRTTPSRHDPIPLDPEVPGMSTAEGTGRNDAQLADSTGSGAAIRTSVISEPAGGAGGSGGSGTYRTGQVSMVGGSGNTCPGPNCPANTGNLNSQLQNLPPNVLRELTGYSIPGLGNTTPCTPSTGPGGCNPQTGSSAAPGAPTLTQQIQSANQAALQGPGQSMTQSATNTGPACSQYGANGQCLTQQGAQGPLGSSCLRYVGSQCAYYGSPTTPAVGTASGVSTAGTLTGATTGATTAGAAGCAQWSGNGQCLVPATTAGTAGGVAGQATGYPANLLGSATGTTATTSGSLVNPATAALTTASSAWQPTTAATATSAYPGTTGAVSTPYAPATGTAPATGGAAGVCLQFGPSGTCARYQ